MSERKEKYTVILQSVCMVIFAVCILYLTVLCRTPQKISYELIPFWSYYEAIFKGRFDLVKEILFNIVLFVPLGFIAGSVFRKNRLTASAVIGLVLSAVIEICQGVFSLGTVEFDDIFNNVLGTLAGCVIYVLTDRYIRKKWVTVLISVSACVFGIAYCISYKPVTNYPNIFDFQLDAVEYDDSGELTLTGFFFKYDGNSDVVIALKNSRTGKIIYLDTDDGLERTDVNNYFLCDTDYTCSGFEAADTKSSVQPDQEYEVLVKLPEYILPISTDTYIKGRNIYYFPERTFENPDVAGTDLEIIVNDGKLRVFREDRHLWIYQYGWELYYIAEDGFKFEDDYATYIEYQTWTTQADRLPEERLKNSYYWDEIGGNFEYNEITNQIDCGNYRVCRLPIPTEYSVISIMTGYCPSNEGWVWRNFFRPWYDFGELERFG